MKSVKHAYYILYIDYNKMVWANNGTTTPDRGSFHMNIQLFLLPFCTVMQVCHKNDVGD